MYLCPKCKSGMAYSALNDDYVCLECGKEIPTCQLKHLGALEVSGEGLEVSEAMRQRIAALEADLARERSQNEQLRADVKAAGDEITCAARILEGLVTTNGGCLASLAKKTMREKGDLDFALTRAVQIIESVIGERDAFDLEVDCWVDTWNRACAEVTKYRERADRAEMEMKTLKARTGGKDTQS